MFREYKLIALLCGILFPGEFVHGQTYAQSSKPEERRTAIKALGDTIRNKMKEYNIVGASVALVDKDSIFWSGGFGYTDLTKRKPVDVQTLFSTQSISKTYTTTAFMLEVDKGTYDLDDKVIRYLPTLRVHSRNGDNEAGKITFRHLLSHRAGFCQEAPLGNNYDTVRCSFDQHIESINGSWLRFPVNQFYSYSNIGMDLIGYILARDAGLPVEEYLKRHLLQPLGMSNSTYNQDEAYSSGNLAHGYYGNKQVERTYIGDVAAGGLYSNVSDMAKFVRMQLNVSPPYEAQFISANLHNEMRRIQFAAEGQIAGYGLGLMIRPFAGFKLYYHPGGGYGYRAEQAWIPEAGIGVIVLTNDGDGSAFCREILESSMKSMLRMKGYPAKTDSVISKDRKSVSLDKSYLQRLSGTYKTDRRLITLTEKEGRLTLHSGSTITRLDAVSKTEFFAENGDRFLFYFDNAGEVSHFINLNQYDASFYIYNDSPKEKPGVIKPGYRDLVGTYIGYNNRQFQSIKIFIKNNYLYSSFGGSTKVTEFKPGIFFTSDGESIIKKGNVMYLGNRAFTKVNDE